MQTFDVAVVGLGALGSAATYHLARRGVKLVAFEQFDLGHVRGASHDTSRIVRTSYGAREYVRFAKSAYRDWADLEAESGERLLTITGGVIMIPSAGPYAASDFTESLAAEQVPYELLAPSEVAYRWPQFAVPEGVETVYTEDSGMVHAARTVATLQLRARALGAELRDRTTVLSLTPQAGGTVVHTSGGDVSVGTVILAADAWSNRLLEPLGAEVPLQVMQEQVTYFAPRDASAFAEDRFPVWIWEDDLCFYGFPTFGEPSIKAARDLSENLMSPEDRTFVPSPELTEQLAQFMRAMVPGSGDVLRTVTCQYAIAPDRRFILGPLPEHPGILLALASGHGFKFTPAFGRVLAELAIDGSTSDDVSRFQFTPPGTA